MPSLKDLRVRIASVKSTQKITSAMKMVAAAKLKRAQAAAEQGRPYSVSMERMLANLLRGIPSLEHAPKLLAGHGSEQKHLLVIITSDRGLAGGFNANIAREARRRINALQREGKEVKLLMIGRKGRDALRRDHGRLIIDMLENVTRNGAQFEPARDISRRLRKMYDAGEFDVCTLIFNTFKSAMSADRHGEADHPLPRRRSAARRRRGDGRRTASTRWSRRKTSCFATSCRQTSRCRSSGLCWRATPPSRGPG